MKALLFIIALFATLLMPAQEIGDAVLARVGDTVITSFDVRMATAQEEATLPASLSNHERMEAVADLRAKALDTLILNELVWMDFQELKAKMPKEYLQQRIDQIIQMRANANEELFRDMLHRDNLTYKDFEDSITKNLAIDMLLYDRTRRNIFITTEQIEKYFAEHAQDFVQETRFHIQAIQIPKEEGYQDIVAEVRAKLSQGDDFGDLARTYSKASSAENGGDLGWMTSMAPALEKEILPLQPGNVVQNDIVIGNSVYIVRLMEREGGQAVEMTPDIQKKIKTILEDLEAEQKQEKYLQSLTMKYPVRRYL